MINEIRGGYLLLSDLQLLKRDQGKEILKRREIMLYVLIRMMGETERERKLGGVEISELSDIV